jgi:L-lactate dehydrogenase (cytochrome)
MLHSEGEVAAAKAATHHGTLYTLSSMSTTGIMEISELHKGPKLFQLYIWKDSRDLLRDVLAQAKEGGFDALVLTVDVPWMGNCKRDLHNGFLIPSNYSFHQMIEAIKKLA